MRNLPDTRRVVLLGGGIGAAIIGFIVVLAVLPQGLRGFLLGGKGAVDLVVGLAQLGALLYAGYLAWQSFRMNREVGVANRYQKGIKLLANASQSAAIGGVYLLREVMRSSPDTYLWPVIAPLNQRVRERDKAIVDEVYSQSWTELAPRKFERSDPVAINALRTIAKTPMNRRWNIDDRRDDVFDVWSFLMNDYIIAWRNFSKMRFRRSVVVDLAIFENCEFEDVTFELRLIRSALTFKRCKLTNVRFFVEVDEHVIPAISEAIAFEHCDITNVTVRPRLEWHDAVQGR